MLYITTRNDRDTFTAQRVMRENRGPDGGMYLSFRRMNLTAGDLKALAAMSFGERVAQTLNRLFDCKCTGLDVDFCVGRSPVRLSKLGHRLLAAEVWHNPGWSYERMEKELTGLLREEPAAPEGWLKIALRIAVLFGIYGELQRSGIEIADLAVVSGDFTAPISAYYARQWGLPIGEIVCCCNENSALWDLFAHGQLRTDAVSIPTQVPEADAAVPDQLERLVYEAGGTAEVEKYLTVCRRGGVYAPEEAVLGKLRQGFAVSVVSSARVRGTIPSAYRTHHKVLSPGTALAYAGLMDYRAKTGNTRPAVILSEKSPLADLDVTASAMGISPETLKTIL